MSDPKNTGEGGDSGLELDWGSRRSRAEPAPSEETEPILMAVPVAEPLRPAAAVWAGDAEDASIERNFRRIAVPAALLGSWVFVQTGMGAFLAKIFSGMWLHEFGHAITAWLCGVFAVPGPWKTMVAEGRSFGVSAAVFGGIAWWTYVLLARQQFRKLWGPATLLVLQLVGTLGLAPSKAQAMITFGGDGGALILGTVLILTFYSRRGSKLREGWLRWGFLGLGALGFMETADTWWSAVRDVDAIPFGEIEGVGASDPVRLTEWYGWTVSGMVRTYVATSVLALGVVAAFYVRGWFHVDEDPEEIG